MSDVIHMTRWEVEDIHEALVKACNLRDALLGARLITPNGPLAGRSDWPGMRDLCERKLLEGASPPHGHGVRDVEGEAATGG